MNENIIGNDLPEVDPEDVFLISVFLEDGLQTPLESVNGGLTCAEDGESGQLKSMSLSLQISIFLSARIQDDHEPINIYKSYPSEVGSTLSSGSSFSKSVNAFEGIGHGLEVSQGGHHLDSDEYH